MHTAARTEVTQVLGEYRDNTHAHTLTHTFLLHATSRGSSIWRDESATTVN